MTLAKQATPLVEREAWKALVAHAKKMQTATIQALFAKDAGRGERMTAKGPGLLLDYSKNRVTDETLGLLVKLAEECGLKQRTEAMFTGEKINITENRAVLHVALRAPEGEKIVVDGQDVVPQVHAMLNKMAAFAERVRSGEWKGQTGKRIRNVVCVERGWDGLCRGGGGSRGGRDDVSGGVKDVYDA